MSKNRKSCHTYIMFFISCFVLRFTSCFIVLHSLLYASFFASHMFFVPRFRRKKVGIAGIASLVPWRCKQMNKPTRRRRSPKNVTVYIGGTYISQVNKAANRCNQHYWLLGYHKLIFCKCTEQNNSGYARNICYLWAKGT